MNDETLTLTAGHSHPGGTCFWCGFIHRAKCPLVKAIEYHADGVTMKRVEFFSDVATLGADGVLIHE